MGFGENRIQTNKNEKKIFDMKEIFSKFQGKSKNKEINKIEDKFKLNVEKESKKQDELTEPERIRLIASRIKDKNNTKILSVRIPSSVKDFVYNFARENNLKIGDVFIYLIETLKR
jgi:hypothetical protein